MPYGSDPTTPPPIASGYGKDPTAPPTPVEPSRLQKIVHGFQGPLVGLDLLASQVEQHLPFISKETAKSDLEAAQREKAEFESRAPTGFSGLELLGNMLNPLN